MPGLQEAYYISFAFQFEPVDRDVFFTKIFPAVYSPSDEEGAGARNERDAERQRLALFFAVLSVAPILMFLLPLI
jgi:hypothetical protein